MRALRILLILVVVFGGLFVAADRAAVYFAEGQIADKIRSSQGLSSQPQVSIKGFPFLTQVLGSSVDEVDIALDGVSATADGHQVQVTEVSAELKNVKIDSSFSSATAAQASGSAHISYADLAKSAPKGATVGYAGADRAAKGQVKLSGRPGGRAGRRGHRHAVLRAGAAGRPGCHGVQHGLAGGRQHGPAARRGPARAAGAGSERAGAGRGQLRPQARRTAVHHQAGPDHRLGERPPVQPARARTSRSRAREWNGSRTGWPTPSGVASVRSDGRTPGRSGSRTPGWANSRMVGWPDGETVVSAPQKADGRKRRAGRR